MENEAKLIEALNSIKNTYGVSFIYKPEKVKSILLDLAPDCKKEIGIFINVLNHTEIVKVLESNPSIQIEQIICRIVDEIGMSNAWATVSAKLLFEYFDLEYDLETVSDEHPSETDLTSEIIENESILMKPTAYDSTISPLIQRIQIFLEDGDYLEAVKYCDRVLDLDPHCAMGYLYKLMAERQIKSVSDLCGCMDVSKDRLFIRALSVADDGLKKELQLIADEENRKSIKRCETMRSASKIQETIISASNYHVAGVCSDGTVWAIGGKNRDAPECKVSGWKNIVAVSAGSEFTVGVKADGHVVITDNATCTDYGSGYGSNWTTYSFDLSGWQDIVAVSSNAHIVGLRSNGTVVAQGVNRYGECNVGGWTNIISIVTAYEVTAGLRADGTVLITGNKEKGDYNAQQWRDIVAIAATMYNIIGLKRDGTVVCTGPNNTFGQCDVADWKDIIAISSNGWTTFGVKADGTVVATKRNSWGEADVYSMRDVVAVTPMGQQNIFATFCVKNDGTIVSTGTHINGIERALNKRLFHSFDTWEVEFSEYKEKAKNNELQTQRRIQQELQQNEEYRSQNLCQYCGGSFKGFFSKKCIKCGKEKDY